MDDKTLLVIGAGLLHCYTIREAQALGLRVVCTDGNPDAPGFKLCGSYVLDVYDIDSHRALARALARTEHLVGATGAGGDTAPTVAAAAHEAGLPGIPYEVAQRTWNKAQVRAILCAAGLQCYQPPWAISAFSVGSLNTWIVQDTVRTYGCGVVKPLSQRASRGITLVDDPENATLAEHAWKHAQRADLKASGFLIEKRLIGSEHSAEVLFNASGACVHFHVCDRVFSYAHGLPLELGHINPSRLSRDQLNAIRAMLMDSAAAMGVTIGPWKCDVIWAENGPKIIEVTARCSGGFDAQVSYPRSSGDNLLRRIIQASCGMPITWQQRPLEDHYCAVAAIIPRTAGTVKKLPDLGGEVIWTVKPGETVQPPQHCAERAGFVVTEGADYHDTWELAETHAEEYAKALAELTI